MIYTMEISKRTQKQLQAFTEENPSNQITQIELDPKFKALANFKVML